MDVTNLRHSSSASVGSRTAGARIVASAAAGLPRTPDTLEILRVGALTGREPARVGAGYTLFPSREDPRLLLPTTSRAAAARALQLRYNGQRPLPARAKRAAAAFAVRAGVLRNVAGPDAADNNPNPALSGLAAHLSNLLGSPVLLGTRVRRLDPHQSQVMLALSPDGKRLAYVKIAWNGLTRQLLDAEEAALRRCELERLRWLQAPQVLARTSYRDLDLLVTRPLPPGLPPLRPRLDLPSAKVMAELAGVGLRERVALGDSQYWAGVRKRVDSLAADCGPDTAAYLEDRMAAVLELAGSRAIEFGGWHGDLVPWNYAQRRGRIQVWDWEYWQESAPLGLEEMQYHFGRQFFGVGRRAGEAASAALDIVPGAAPGDADQLALTRLCFVVELVLRRLVITAAGGGQDDDRAFPDLFLLLDHRLREGGAAVTAPWPRGAGVNGADPDQPDAEGPHE
jgi:hypothetical protein